MLAGIVGAVSAKTFYESWSGFEDVEEVYDRAIDRAERRLLEEL